MTKKILILILSLILLSCDEDKKTQGTAVADIAVAVKNVDTIAIKNVDTLPYSIGQVLWYVGASTDSILENEIVKFKGVRNGKILLEKHSGEFSPQDFNIAIENEQCLD